MIEKILNIIKYDSESAILDFKRNEYPLGKHAKKNELLKDISAMTNHHSDAPKYILIGIKEKNGLASEFFDIENLTDQANYQQFIEENIEPKIYFQYKIFEYEGHKLAAFIISENQSRPCLFKKNIHRTTDKAIEYRIGDGFIRSGTSTRKLSRNDFELIYDNKLRNKDRTSDLEINPILKENNDWLEGQFTHYNLDFSIKNLSSKSIIFDAECKIPRSTGITLKKTIDLQRKSDQNGLKSIYPHHFSPTIDSTILDIDITEEHDSYKAIRLRKVELSQMEKLENLLLNDLFLGVLNNLHQQKISIELILRSDDFKNGPLIKKYEFKLGS